MRLKFVLLGNWWNEAVFFVEEGAYLISHLRVGLLFAVQ